MSYLLHGSTSHTGMGWVDRIPRAGGNLYIGGLYALYQTDLIKAANITHVLSVVDYEPNLSPNEHLSGLEKMHVWAEDDPNEDLLKWFEKTTKFVREGLQGNGGVFVHCAMGKSRSAAVVVAFLMWEFGVGVEEGLRWVEEGRPVCEPNPGFKEQLRVWEKMLKEQDGVKRQDIYQAFEKNRFKGSAWEWEKRAEVEEKARL
ncbi:uncharacterized protein N0V89_007190 [Didymosphaeria variabile]|uniref:Protein-tyrosine-phosphatase n=1 Tax=Didymosphaeria variabile TaxID=1932322 RepID=A0A9W8XKE1_9PLEO|nr:uncharacterized protein N0V89_007190 [Didymosphaeria variabile]KAJ4351846.1 hypothetical protein N0V89_007190 [Didymosphaeria variabile]